MLLSEREQLEYDMLAILGQAVQPVGCGAISTVLQQRGRVISEATVGRILRDFDQLGLSDKTGYQGRTLSMKGKNRLLDLEHKKKSLQWGITFANMLNGHTKKELLEILVARRAIEGELAFLAAQHPVPTDVEQLTEILKRQKKAAEAGGEASQEDVEFHALIAKMASNRVLSAAIGLIRQDTQLSPVLEYIRKNVHGMVFIDHKNIFAAIKKSQPQAARKAMVQHLDNLAADVEKYWENIK